MFLIFLLGSISSFGQLKEYEFDQYTTEDGLSNGYIYSIFHDSKGFIWIGTANGLNRFDGIHFKNYYYDPDDSTTISGIGVTSIIEDDQGNIWLATTSGLCVYNRKKDNFERKKLRLGDGRIFEYQYGSSSYIDKADNFWLSTYNGIFRFNLKEYLPAPDQIIDAELFEINEPDVDVVYRNYFSSFDEDQKGNIWLASFSNNIFSYDKELNKFVPFPIKVSQKVSLSNQSKEIFFDSDGDFYISSSGTGLMTRCKDLNEFSLLNDGNHKAPNGKIILSIIEDRNGKLWFGDSYSEGLSILDKKTGKYTYSRYDELNPYSLLTNKINTIYEDRNGTIWIGTIIGLNKYSPGKSKFNRYYSNLNQPNSLSFNNVLCFEESKNGSVWIGTDGGGLNNFDRLTGKFTHYTHNPSDRNSISSNAIISLCEDTEGTLWIGTYDGGLGRFKNNKFDAFFPDKNNPYAISSRHIWNVLEDSKKNLWVATLNSGLDLFDRESGRFYNYYHDSIAQNFLIANSINGLFEDSRQHLYITTAGGVSVIDLNEVDFTTSPPGIQFRNYIYDAGSNSLSSINVYCTNEDKNGNIWFGTFGSGLDMLDAETGLFTNYSTSNGLPGNSITSILVDDFNNLWLATDNGLARFNPETKEVNVFGRADGLQNKNMKGWALKTRNGQMFFGGTNGFNSFFPEQVEMGKNNHKPPVVFTGLKIFNRKIEIGEPINGRVVLQNDIDETQELILSYRENFFTIEFVALDFTTPEKNKYAYMMEGFDNNWIYSGNKKEANYTNLDPGQYTFKVKASNNDGIWNDEGASLQIIILPPWWKTWWFRLILGFSIFTFVLSVFMARVRSLKKQKILLEHLVEEKTSKLIEMNTMLLEQKDALEFMNKELNNLNATKDKFFSIIAHDIRAPFNSILGFSELLLEKYLIWTDEVKIKTIKLVLESSRNLYELLEHLLLWSRSQRGSIEYKPEPIKLKEVCTNLIGLLKANAESKNIKIELLLSNKEFAVYADKLMLDTILRNLVSNALKFTNEGGKVQIVAKEDAGLAKIEVIDNGVGISPSNIDKLFRIESNQTTLGTNNEKGTGLGLVLVKDFVEQQGGKILVESEIGKGSKFIFTLPLWG
jgi:signal transduction histidine kinase/ligand-binding sensor domain-containing protein